MSEENNVREHTADEVGNWFNEKVTIEYAKGINEFGKYYKNSRGISR